MNKLANVIKAIRHDFGLVKDRQEHVYDEIRYVSSRLAKPNFDEICTDDLHLLFELYDQVYCQGQLRKMLLAQGTPLTMRLSKRMTSAGGKTTMVHPHGRHSLKGKTFEIAISTTLLFESFQTDESQETRVVGLKCANRLEALQRTFEHEFVHLIEMIIWLNSSCAKARFRAIAHNMFGHLESNHQLTTPQDSARRKLGIQPGDTVLFRYGQEQLLGFVNRITRRATVLVRDSKGDLFDDGFRYRKFYVPLDALKKAA